MVCYILIRVRHLWLQILLVSLLFGFALAYCDAASYQYIRIGQKTDSKTKPSPGIAMMGGGDDLDEAFRWLCKKANGGDFLVLRARGDDDYNSYINGLCKLNSVATLIIPDHDASQDPAVAEIIRHAEALFIAGGDQARYVNFWRGTSVQDAINANLAVGKPIGGTSAGLAVLGEFSYGALGDAPDDDDLTSADVLRDPYFRRVTLVRGLLENSRLRGFLTDSHFAKRDRMGRSLGFLARVIQDAWSSTLREIAMDEGSAVLVEGGGKASVVGPGKGAYFLRPTEAPEICRPNAPLTFRNISVYRAPAGARFDISKWHGEGGAGYSLSVEQGVIHSTQTGGGIY